MKKIKAIAAMAENRVIGYKGRIPWHLPEDFRWFKQATMGGVLVMGRKTYESIGKPLPGRETYVLSRTTRSIEGVHNFTNLDILKEIDTNKTIWIAGGAEIYQQMLPLCQEIYLSRVHNSYQGDTEFPVFENGFRLTEKIIVTQDFDVERWEKS